jgi:hypothetical protein
MDNSSDTSPVRMRTNTKKYLSSSDSEEYKTTRRRPASPAPQKLADYTEDTAAASLAELDIHMHKDVLSIVSSFFSGFMGEEKKTAAGSRNIIVHLDSNRSIVHYIQPTGKYFYFVSKNLESENEKRVKLDKLHKLRNRSAIGVSLYGNLLSFNSLLKREIYLYDIRSGKILFSVKWPNNLKYDTAKIVAIVDNDIILLLEYDKNNCLVLSIDMKGEVINFTKDIVGKYIGLTANKELIFYSDDNFITLS